MSKERTPVEIDGADADEAMDNVHKLTPSVKYTLAFPITGKARTVEVIDIRRPSIREQEAAAKALPPRASEEERSRYFVMLLCGLSPDEMSGMDMLDFSQISQIVGKFISVQPPTSGE